MESKEGENKPLFRVRPVPPGSFDDRARGRPVDRTRSSAGTKSGWPRFNGSDDAATNSGWFQARAGRVTGSRAAAAVGMLKSGKGETAARRDLRTQLVIERIRGAPLEGPNDLASREMWIGLEREAEAIRTYEARMGVLVTPVGFVTKGTELGLSPDGFVGDEGCIEVKAPKASTHYAYLRSCGELPTGFAMPEDYRPQVAHALHVTGRAWCDFVSFCPEWPYPLDLLVIRARPGRRPWWPSTWCGSRCSSPSCERKKRRSGRCSMRWP